MVKVNFFLRKRGKVESTNRGRVAYPVYSILMRVSFYGKRMELLTGLHACEIQWNRESQRVKLDVEGMMPKSCVVASNLIHAMIFGSKLPNYQDMVDTAMEYDEQIADHLCFFYIINDHST